MQETADLVIFTEKILLEKFIFCAVYNTVHVMNSFHLKLFFFFQVNKYFCVSEAFILNLNNPLIRFR